MSEMSSSKEVLGGERCGEVRKVTVWRGKSGSLFKVTQNTSGLSC